MRQRMLALAAAVIVVAALGPRTFNAFRSVFAFQSAAKTFAVSSTPVSIPFDLSGRHIILKVTVNNSPPLSFVLDTGARYSIINLDRAKELGLTLEGEIRVGGAGIQTATGSFVRNSTFTIPGLSGFSQPVSMALPIGHLAQRMGHDFDGILGSDFISEFVVEIDYLARRLKLHDKERFNYAGPGESLPIKLTQHGHPILEAEVTPIGSEPVRGKFVLDIGAGSALALHSPFVNERQLLGPNLKTIKALGGAGAGGEIAGRIGRVAELKIGSYKLTDPITLFSQDKAGALANASLLGNIGAQVANRFKLFLDYERDRIIFEPNSDFGKPYDRAFAGVSLQGEGKDYRTFRITSVLENSPASEIGLQIGDVITEVDGKAARDLVLSTLNGMFEKPVTYKLKIKRGEQTLQVSLTPRKLV